MSWFKKKPRFGFMKRKREAPDGLWLKCDGCGECVPSCAEGAIQIIDGKARLLDDKLCDGLGACLGHCPQGAITVQPAVEPWPIEENHSLEAFFAHRRSCRRFTPERVDSQTLARITRVAGLVPSGGNNQAHGLTILTDSRVRSELERSLEKIYRSKRRLLANPVLRMLGRMFSDRDTRACLGPRSAS